MIVRTRSPGKIIFSGEHAVVYNRTSLVGAISLYSECEIKTPGTLNQIQLTISNEVFTWPLDELVYQPVRNGEQAICEIMIHADKLARVGSSRCKNSNLVGAKIFLTQCMLALKRWPVSMDVIIKSDIPVEAGLGSSASMNVCLAAALLAVANVIKPEDMTSDKCLTHSQKSQINDLAFIGEKVAHGTPSGVDNFVATFGGLHMIKDGKSSKRINYNIDCLITNSGVLKSTLKQVAKVSEMYKKIPEVLNGIFQAISGISEKIGTILDEGNYEDPENISTVENLIGMNQQLLCALGVSHPKIDEICNISNMMGNLPTKLTGAGGGGCTITCINNRNRDNVKKFSDLLSEINFTCFKVNIDHDGVKIAFED